MFFENLVEATDPLPHMSSRNGMQRKRVTDLLKSNTQEPDQVKTPGTL